MANILHEVQDYVVGKLSADYQLSGACVFLAENRKDIDYEIKNALARQGIVGVVMTPKATYAGKYEDLFLAWTLEELEIDIVENVIVNRGKKDGYMTGQDVGLRVFDVLCPLSGDYEGQFCPQSIEEGEDSGLIVNKCILKALVYGEHGDTPRPEPGLNMQFVKLLDGPPSKPPHDGWMWPQDDGFVIWQNGQQHVLGNLTFNAMSAYVSQQLSGYLPAEIYGAHDEWATVKKVIEIQDVRPDSDNEPVLTLVQNNSNRSLEIINTSSLATLNFGVLSSGVPKISFGVDDPETFNTVYFQNKSGTLAYQSDLSDYLSISGGVMYGTIEFSPDTDQELGYKLLQLNPTGEYWQALFGVDDGQGQPYVAHNGSETGAGAFGQYTWKLFFPDENGTLATREWTQGTLSGKADANDLSAYLPLSGGTITGNLSVGNNVVLEQDLGGGILKVSDGQGNWTWYQGSWINHNGSNFLYPTSQQPDDYTLATQEWTQGELSAYPQSNEISATRVETMTTIHESDWAAISASASSSTLYIVIPD